MTGAAQQIVAAIADWLLQEPGPLVVAIDGHGAAGKTTIAGEVAFTLGAILVHTDDYFHEAQDNGDRRPMSQYYAWQELRERALEPAIGLVQQGPGAPLVIVEGVSSAAPALADLATRAVFIDTPEPVRLERLHGRISEEEWDEEWLYAERLYFTSRPPESFDLVVSGTV